MTSIAVIGCSDSDLADKWPKILRNLGFAPGRYYLLLSFGGPQAYLDTTGESRDIQMAKRLGCSTFLLFQHDDCKAYKDTSDPDSLQLNDLYQLSRVIQKNEPDGIVVKLFMITGTRTEEPHAEEVISLCTTH